MNELSIEEKAIRYDETLDRAKKELDACGSQKCDAARQIFRFFPELKEPDDERIRKELIDYHRSMAAGADDYVHEAWIAWLEKQGEKDKEILILKDQIESLHAAIEAIKETHRIELEKQGEQKSFARYKVGDTIYYDSFGRLVSFVIANIVEDGTDNPMYEDKDGNSVFQNDIVEQKPADKVEPKFHVNEWVVTDKNDVVQIKAVYNGYYTIDNGMGYYMPYVDRYWHKWTIQDAKDGDVLYECNEKKPFIFKELETKHIGDIASYCDIFNGIFNPNEDDWTTLDIVPATKEQRNLLFQKMHEAGYEWDAEKKELKKIEYQHICELDNSCACVTFPFKAKVKSSGTIVIWFSEQYQWELVKEPVSEDLGEYINELSKQFPEVSFAKLSRIAVRVAKWQKQQMKMTKRIKKL